MIENPADFERVDPESFRAFLRGNGWIFEPDASWSDNTELWVLDDREVLVPLRKTYRDYATLVREGVLEVARMVDRAEDVVLRELLAIGFDTLHFRLGTDKGVYSIALKEGRRLIGDIWHMMYSAAAATVEPRRTLPPRNTLAEAYMKQLRMPVPEPGSFALAVQSPAPTADDIAVQEQELAVDNTGHAPRPLRHLIGRDVVRTLVTAIDAAEHAATEAIRRGDLTPFNQSVTAGVSVTLCKAMASLEKQSGRFVEVAVDLSLAVEVDSEQRTFLARPRRLHRDRGEIYERAAEFLSQPSETRPVEVVGYVTELRRPTGSMFGTVVVKPQYGAPRRTVRVVMLAEDFSKATLALDRNLPLRCVGVVREESYRRLIMDRPEEVDVPW